MASTTATALIIGSTGNVGIAAVIGALRANLSVLAVVRNSTSAEKLFRHVGTREGITTVEADITDEKGVKGVVEQVKAGKLPAFQHVYAVAGGSLSKTPMHEVSMEEIDQTMEINFRANLCQNLARSQDQPRLTTPTPDAYRATIPYLLSQKVPSTWTLVTGGLGDVGMFAGTAISQGALYSMASAASLELKDTNVRFNEVYLNLRVEVDEVAKQNGTFKSSDLAENYRAILGREDVRGSRVTVDTGESIKELEVTPKGKSWKNARP